MKKIICLLFVLVVLSNKSIAQDSTRIRFFIDSNEVRLYDNFKINIKYNKKIIKLKSSDNIIKGIKIDQQTKYITLVFAFKSYKLEFKKLPVGILNEKQLIFEYDTFPFDEDNIIGIYDGKEGQIKYIYNIKYSGIVQSIVVWKK